jgi:nucleotide-binding universal stress UspA family protein
MDTTGVVVVGVDGSPSARAALDHALRDAARRSARVRIIAVGAPPERWEAVYGMTAPPPPADVRVFLRETVEQQIAAVLDADPLLAAVERDVEAVVGAPGPVLVDASDGAELLVLGHRGRGALSSMLLGSVGLHCVLHAHCPVTVICGAPAEVAEAAAAPATVPA